MRKIMQCGKRKDNGEWVNGYFNPPCNICFEEIGDDEVIGAKSVPIWHDYAVIPESVGEYAGIDDKTGKEIFEGHIIKAQDNLITSPFCDGIVGKVIFEECAFL